MEMKATKAEVEYLIQLGKLEVEAASRVAAGVLKLLQLHGAVGLSAIDQLNSIGLCNCVPLFHLSKFKFFDRFGG